MIRSAPIAFDALVFDFDGVIIESVAVKGRAFRQLFPKYPEHADRFEQYHYENGGMPRHQKIEWFYRELLGEPAPPAEVDRLAECFGALVARAMLTCPMVAGAGELLERYAPRVPLFVASGTPEDELRDLVGARGLATHFRGVFGAPARKGQILNDIAARLGVPPSRLLFVGDGRQDAEAARETGVPFVGVVAPGQTDRLGDVPMFRVADLFELDRRLTESLL